MCSHTFYGIFYMDISTAKAEATTGRGLPHLKHTHPSTQPLTWQDDIKSLAQETDCTSTSRGYRSTSRRHRNNLVLPESI